MDKKISVAADRFLTTEDLKNGIYEYQTEQITELDESIIYQALATAEDEVKSYLYANDKKEFLDGRKRYDVEAIFSARGEERNALILMHCITIAKWYIIQLANPDVIHEHAKERYDRATDWLKKIAKGELTLSSLPTLKDNESESNADNKRDERLPFRFGSREKFNHA